MVKFIDHLDLVAEMNRYGWLRVELTSSVGWDGFPDYANRFIGFLSGSIGGKVDAVDVRIWEVCVHGENMRLVYDDFPVMITLEAGSNRGNEIVLRIIEKLVGWSCM